MSGILVIGASGQVGTELTAELRRRYGRDEVTATDLRRPEGELAQGPTGVADVTDYDGLKRLFRSYRPEAVYNMAGVLSAVGEIKPNLAFDVNLVGSKNVLAAAAKCGVRQVFYPSSIAVFGPTTPKEAVPQETVMVPETMYGACKLSVELLCRFYWSRSGLDVRCLRYPGLISHRTPPGGGTTDYAVAMFFGAVRSGHYECFVGPDTVLPMMYMPDAIRATVELMAAPADSVRVRLGYNLAAMSFSARELAEAIARKVPGFACTFRPDYRQGIADSWPRSVDDSAARADWGWRHEFGLDETVRDMLENVQ